MSYILDALRRADAERDRGNVPGLHTHGYGAPPPPSATIAARPWLGLATGVVATAAIGALAWTLFGPARRGEGVAAPAATAPAVLATAPVTAAPAAVAPIPPPVTATALPPVPPTPTAAVTRSESAAVARRAKAAAAPASATAAADAKPSATAEKVYAVAELPEDIRSQLPVLAVGGSMYSSKPADRLLILNGQVVHEGDKIGNDLVLQQIRLKSALLSFKGYRYTMNF